jgi:translation elongation factor P/translation initiation factor 5A
VPEKEFIMITAGDFRNGVTFEMEGKVYQVIEFQHVKPGKGAAFVRTKYRDVVTGAIREASFNPTAKFETVSVERRELQYLYNDGELYYFMDMESYEQLPVDSHKLGDNFKFVKENEMCRLSSIKGKNGYYHILNAHITSPLQQELVTLQSVRVDGVDYPVEQGFFFTTSEPVEYFRIGDIFFNVE